MRKFYVFLLIAVVFAGISFLGFKVWGIYGTHIRLLLMENKIISNPQQEVLAVYDPGNRMKGIPEHFRLQINAESDWQLEKNELQKISKDSPVLLTIEIWGRGVLDSISQGHYDKNIKELLSPLAGRSNLFLRFNPEMEIPDSKNSWSNWGGIYVKAFQQFSTTVQSTLPEARIVWGPSGSMGNMEYYPGSEFFGAASISLDKEDKTDLFLQNSKPEDVLQRKLHRMRFVDAPLMVLGSPQNSEENNSELFSIGFRSYDKVKKVTNLTDIVKEQINRSGPPVLGVYDPKGLLIKMEDVSLEHIFIAFETIKNGVFKKQFSEILSRDHDVIITVEPENLPGVESNVLEEIIAGKYDLLLKEFFETIPKDGPKVYIRFAHEMEIPVDRYPWQQQDPLLYIQAFRYFMQFPGSDKENIFKVWAPAGDRGSVDWWPGSDVVDLISMSIYGLPDKNITDFKKQDSFEKIYIRKKRRLDLFGKPFLIAEFGVKGDEEYQQQWLLNAADVVNKHEEIFGVSYFNQQDLPKAWGEIEPPDWSISRKVFSDFIHALDL